MKRKSTLLYKIVYDYISYFKQYEEVKLKTYDRNEAISCFLDLFKKKQNGSLILDEDCRVKLIVEINMYMRNGIDLIEYKEDDNLNEILDKMENTLTTSYDSFRYTIKIATSSGVIRNYKPIFETEIRDEALEKFLYFFRRKQLNVIGEENFSDIVLEVSISPFDTRCLYLNYVEEEIYIFSKLAQLEKMVIDKFNS